MIPVRQAWITLNRQCNLRCRWCYAHGTEYRRADDLTLERAEQIVRFLSELQPDRVTLLGGEPTCYPHLERVIRLLSESGMRPVLVTNGLALADAGYLDSLVSAGLGGIDISLKGWSQESYAQNTGVRAYGKVLDAVRNTVKLSVESVVSFVISRENVDHFLPAVADARAQGAGFFYFSFEQDFSVLEASDRRHTDLCGIFRMLDRFAAHYEELHSITGGSFRLHQSYPACIWDRSFLNMMAERGQLSTSCQLLEHSGIIFDTNGAVIPCNCMYHLPFGRLGVDFIGKDDFVSFWESERVRGIFRHFMAVPSAVCGECSEWDGCKGGCIGNWFEYTHQELLEAYQKYRGGVRPQTP